jgi:N-hydroxyarylamine O-acetyltransferase
MIATAQPFDIDAYLGRIGYQGALEPGLATLEGLHRAHLARIPFENIDVRLGRPISLDLEALQAKIVGRRRGGYCFEQNSLFAAALRAVGFEVATLEARVRPPGATGTLPRTHMLLLTTVEGREWIADVGFGGDGPLVPVPLDGAPGEQPDGVYQVVRESADGYALRRSWNGAWRDLYGFTLTPALPVDFEVANHFTSTHPSSRFVRTLTVQRTLADARKILRGRAYTVRRPGRETVREFEPAELPSLLADEFDLDVPAADAVAALGDP